ncbi:cytosine permease [Acetobacter sp. TBRC 12305]|uniref:Cytosine permease n=1 Tax=Acetobacter garciniae TaxID=2817435 RepID=A0A939KM12_9PROT|nr:cytosine permease [Acetobacter garciniae]MBO1324803.1 cytosine permease [Acetobacter garciniae]MBX0344494.1 cytosine permease [Acetobacter garciniae]
MNGSQTTQAPATGHVGGGEDLVEQYGIQPIPLADRASTLGAVAVIFFNICLNPGAIMRAGLSVCAGLPYLWAVGVQVLGTFSAAIFCIVLARIGCDYGIPGQVATRSAFGVMGARYFCSLTRVLASIYNFAFQNLVGCLSIQEFVRLTTGHTVSLTVFAVLFGCAQALVGIFGFRVLKNLSGLATPIKVGIIFFLMTRLPLGSLSLTAQPMTGVIVWPSWLLIATWVDVYASVWMTLAPDAADFTRHMKSRRGLYLTMTLSIIAGSLLASAFGALGPALSAGKDANVLSVVMDGGAGFRTNCLVILLVVFDNWTINALNVYTSGLSLCNLLPRISRLFATIIVAVLGLTLSMLGNALSDLVQFHAWIGTIFAPVTGVLIADYLVVRRQALDVPALYTRHGQYWYTVGFNPRAIAAVAVGVVVFRFLPESTLRPLACFLIVALCYLALCLAARRGAGQGGLADGLHAPR